MLREKARTYWQKIETLFSSAGHNGANQTNGRWLKDAHAGETKTP
jgi:hypothetical protein